MDWLLIPLFSKKVIDYSEQVLSGLNGSLTIVVVLCVVLSLPSSIGHFLLFVAHVADVLHVVWINHLRLRQVASWLRALALRATSCELGQLGISLL